MRLLKYARYKSFLMGGKKIYYFQLLHLKLISSKSIIPLQRIFRSIYYNTHRGHGSRGTIRVRGLFLRLKSSENVQGLTRKIL